MIYSKIINLLWILQKFRFYFSIKKHKSVSLLIPINNIFNYGQNTINTDSTNNFTEAVRNIIIIEILI